MSNQAEKNNQSGFSLIELLISIVIMLIVVGAVFTVFNSSLRVSTTSNEMADAEQNLRIGQEYITRDLYNTGDGLRGLNPMITNAFLASYLSLDSTDPTNTFVPATMVLADDSAPANTQITGSPAGTLLLGSDRISFLLTPNFVGQMADISGVKLVSNGKYRSSGLNEMYVTNAAAATLKVGEIYVLFNTKATAASTNSAYFAAITGFQPGTGADSGNTSIKFDGVGDYGLNNTSGGNNVVNILESGGLDEQLTLRRVWIISYYVDNSNRLMRRVYGQAGTNAANQFIPYTETIIAENVTQLQFRYILRREVANVVQAPQVLNVFNTDTAANNQAAQAAVRQIEVSLTTQTSRPISTGQRQPISATTVVSPRNLQFYNSALDNRIGQ